MTRHHVGVDVVSVARFELLLRNCPGIELEIFTARELAYAAARRGCVQHLAARFAAKEAVLKALGSGMASGITWTDVEIVTPPLTRPRVRLAGSAAEFAARAGVEEIDVSLSHVEGVAMAQAIAVLER